jgi:hypothetical protein
MVYDDDEEMLAMLRQKKAREYGIPVHHLNTREFEQSWRSRIWSGIKTVFRYGAPIALGIASAAAHIVPIVTTCVLM